MHHVLQPPTNLVPFPVSPTTVAKQRGERFTPHPKWVGTINSGYMRSVSWQEDGRATTLALWGPGDLLSPSLNTSSELECLTPVVLTAVPQNQVPGQSLQDALVLQLDNAFQLLNILNIKPLPTRLYTFLLWLAQRFGTQQDNGWVLDTRLTHQVIAETIGTTRVTVTRLLTELEHTEHLKRAHHRFFLIG